MLRRTLVIAGSILGVWLIGVSALAFAPKQSSDFDVGVSIGRSVFNDLRTNVYFSRQDLSGRYTVIIRSPGRGYSD
ncbi:MAG: hypothetical protein O7C67_06455 [Gammaproteobacteria bacterium]|nr:hypothetical protein [Gammaproteobacteria bacterium]